MSGLNDRSSILAFMQSRRSASAKALTRPGPDEQQLQQILRIAMRVPDHGKLTPWRFILFEGEARGKFGDVLAQRWRQLYPTHSEETITEQKQMFLRAPCIIAVISTAEKHVKIPLWEQELSAGAVCQNMLIAATALGFGCQWISGWYAYDKEVGAALLLQENERVAGFMYLGTVAEAQTERARPELAELLIKWGADGT